MKTIRRNAHRKIAAIALTIVKVRVYDQMRGGTVDLTEGTTAASAVASAFAYLTDANYGAKLYDNEDGSYTLHVHSNLYFYLYTQAHLDQLAADKAAREQARTATEVSTLHVKHRDDQGDTVWEFAGTETDPSGEPFVWVRNRVGGLQRLTLTGFTHTWIACDRDGRRPTLDVVLSFAPGTKVLWRDDRTECGIVAEDGRPVVIVKTIDGPQGIMADRLIADEPAVTVTRTRMAIGDMIAQACEALGIELGHGWSKGTACYEVNGKIYTAGELADLVLEGGFAANYGGNEVRVNWDCPLVFARTQERRAGRALMITRELQARMGTATARDLEEIAQSLLDMLHGWAIEDAPREKVDFPSGAAEPGDNVAEVRCVRTGEVFMRSGSWWTSRKTGHQATWYQMNLTDPMSEGFQQWATKR